MSPRSRFVHRWRHRNIRAPNAQQAIAKPSDSAYNSLRIHLSLPKKSNPQEPRQAIRIDGHTRILGVFGHPVAHSLSPAMHNAAIAALGLPYVYVPFEVDPDAVGPAVRALPSLGIAGVNLTIPHKQSVIPFLDELTPGARIVGAVNTVQVADGRLIGHNTDVQGFLAPLRSATSDGSDVYTVSAVVLGAGGSARSVVYALLSAGARITIANRTVERADRLAEDLRIQVPGAEVDSTPMDDSLLGALEAAELVVNTTSAGMHPDEESIPPIPLSGIHSGQTVYDLIYRPQETRLLKEARERGANTINGIDMLIHQGAAAFRIWTGFDPPIEIMKKAVCDSLSNQ